MVNPITQSGVVENTLEQAMPVPDRVMVIRGGPLNSLTGTFELKRGYAGQVRILSPGTPYQVRLRSMGKWARNSPARTC